MTINYKIEILSDWHIGSGLDSGADADATVLKDEDNLPYLPGKTIKGLLKDALAEITETEGQEKGKEQINKVFGWEIENKQGKKDKVIRTHAGTAFFSNAILAEQEREEIITNKLSAHLYKNLASTKIEDKTGIAKKGSLRTIEVCIPVTLLGSIEIKNGTGEQENLIEQSLKWVRAIGVNRNRGLGRCQFVKLNK